MLCARSVNFEKAIACIFLPGHAGGGLNPGQAHPPCFCALPLAPYVALPFARNLSSR